MAVAASVLLVANRDPNRAINNYQAGGHVGSVVIVAAGVGAATSLITSNPALVFVAVVAVAARKIWLRRWMVKPKTASSTVVVVP